MKDIREVLYLYLGNEVLCDDLYIFKLTGILPSEVEPKRTIAIVKNDKDVETSEFYIEEVKLILKRLSDMTEEDMKELNWSAQELAHAVSQKRHPSFYNTEFIYLLKKGYWLFGDEAFDQGLIIDRKTV